MTETVRSEHQESVSSSSAVVVCPIRKGSEHQMKLRCLTVEKKYS